MSKRMKYCCIFLAYRSLAEDSVKIFLLLWIINSWFEPNCCSNWLLGRWRRLGWKQWNTLQYWCRSYWLCYMITILLLQGNPLLVAPESFAVFCWSCHCRSLSLSLWHINTHSIAKHHWFLVHLGFGIHVFWFHWKMMYLLIQNDLFFFFFSFLFS